MLRWLTAGESHGPELIAILEGLPAGVPVSLDGIRADLARRKLGYGRGSRQKFEEDELAISGGVIQGASIGSPIALRIGNTEWPKWSEVMSPEPIDAASLGRGRGAPLTRPRPGHADLVGMQKYGFDEARPVLERASARETAARVALGAVARSFLAVGDPAARRHVQHIAAAQQLFRTAFTQNGAGVDFGGYLKGNPAGEVGLDDTRNNVYRWALGGYNEVNTDGAGQLG